MKKRCAELVRKAAREMGRERVSDAELNAIDHRIGDTMRRLARQDRRWDEYSPQQQLRKAAAEAQADIRADAARKAWNMREQLIAQADLQAIEAEMAKLRPGAERARFNPADLSFEQEDAAVKVARQEFYAAAAAAREAGVVIRDLVGDVFVDAGIIASHAVRKALSPARVKQLQEEARYAGLNVRAAETRRYIASLQDAPGQGMPVAARAEPVSVPPGMRDAPDVHRVASMAAQMPDLEVALPGGEQMRLRDVVARIEAEREADNHWADLVRVAAECFLTAG